MKTERALSTENRLNAESTLKKLMQSDIVDAFNNPYLFARTGILSKFLVMDDLY
jgi:hypothetical protein